MLLLSLAVTIVIAWLIASLAWALDNLERSDAARHDAALEASTRYGLDIIASARPICSGSSTLSP